MKLLKEKNITHAILKMFHCQYAICFKCLFKLLASRVSGMYSEMSLQTSLFGESFITSLTLEEIFSSMNFVMCS